MSFEPSGCNSCVVTHCMYCVCVLEVAHQTIHSDFSRCFGMYSYTRPCACEGCPLVAQRAKSNPKPKFLCSSRTILRLRTTSVLREHGRSLKRKLAEPRRGLGRRSPGECLYRTMACQRSCPGDNELAFPSEWCGGPRVFMLRHEPFITELLYAASRTPSGAHCDTHGSNVARRRRHSQCADIPYHRCLGQLAR